MPSGENSLANLKPIKPGESRNPTGRPKGPITQFLREFGDATEIEFSITITKPGKDGAVEKSRSSASISTGQQTINQAVAARLLQMAMNGDIKAIREVLNRTEGRVPHPIVVAGSRSGGGADLKGWTVEELDRYEEWQRQTQAQAESIDYEEVNDNPEE
ncbi:DUF5681 domain-containing protein [Spirosoma sp.]|uniref:DUF5681 domain-containing protein n=1 Tax=Spirosoma sp. TaxID=1899569 RepID=UPI002610D895|nr:DUF5681 domain-containing protein [Spirosoma sp.]MCX6217642.1 DUF5681 domain-containing protein [Spirosoma sp.]